MTEENKDEYIKLVTEWRVSRGQEEQTKAFLEGFSEVLPLEVCRFYEFVSPLSYTILYQIDHYFVLRTINIV